MKLSTDGNWPTQGSANQAVQDQEEKALNWFDLNLAHQVAKILLELHSSSNLRTCYRTKILTKISTAPSTGILSFKFHVEFVFWKIAGLVVNQIFTENYQ